MTEPDFLRSTRASYNAVATDYAERFRGEMAAKPLDRALLAGFVDLVRAAGGGPVADVGCGTGRITAYLHELGLAISGVDLSPGMLAVARRTHPGLRFDEGSILPPAPPGAHRRAAGSGRVAGARADVARARRRGRVRGEDTAGIPAGPQTGRAQRSMSHATKGTDTTLTSVESAIAAETNSGSASYRFAMT